MGTIFHTNIALRCLWRSATMSNSATRSPTKSAGRNRSRFATRSQGKNATKSLTRNATRFLISIAPKNQESTASIRLNLWQKECHEEKDKFGDKLAKLLKW